MKIWKLNFELDKYDNLTFKEKMDIDEIQSFDGRTKKTIGDKEKLLGLNQKKTWFE